MKIKIHALVPSTSVNGPGKRFGIWVQGCSNNCADCFNPNTRDKDGGYWMSVQELCQEICSHSDIDGISISGGEPLEQAEAVFELVKMIKENSSLSVLVFTNAPKSTLLKHSLHIELIDILVLNYSQIAEEIQLLFPKIKVLLSTDMPQDVEVHIDNKGQVLITGFPKPRELEGISQKL